ncbi:MAG: aminotransferase class III-fold pyridoxal phosphate-dependent enzyme, partial [Bdellovibrionales bacterium]|nr:aminotransferase class III-fold pyridoxal phosphate-dependent enzyme [Bdellovibrionales bacterium]
MNHSNSEKLYQRSEQLVPAGVHSPVRAFRSVGGHPIFFKKGLGSKITDVDQNEYLDFCMSWGALSLGHANPLVVNHIKTQAELGTHYGTPTAWDIELAELALDCLKPFNRIRFVNSGTEAVMTALRLARGITGRDLIVKVDGAYHGHVDSLLVSAGSGLVTQGESSSLGVPDSFAKTTIVVPFNNQAALKETFETY